MAGTTLELRAIEPEEGEDLYALIELDEVELPALEWELVSADVAGPGRLASESIESGRPEQESGLAFEGEPTFEIEDEPEPFEIADTVAWLGRRMPIRPQPRPPSVDPGDGPAHIELQTWSELVTLYERDISCGGMYVETRDVPERDAEVTVRLVLPDDTGTIDFDGRVVHVVTEDQAGAGLQVPGFGLQFRGLTPDRRKVLEALIEQAEAVMSDPSAQPPRVRGRALTPVPGLASGYRITLSDSERRRLTEARAELIAIDKRSDLQILGLRTAPDRAQLRRAFDQLAQRWHPSVAHRDAPPEMRSLATEIFLRIERAYRRVSESPRLASAARTGQGPSPRRAAPERSAGPSPASSPSPRRSTIERPSSAAGDRDAIRARQRARLARRVVGNGARDERLAGLERRERSEGKVGVRRKARVKEALALISAKRYAEALIMTYVRTFGANAGVARIFNTYGPRLAERDGRVVSNFILQALKARDITIFGDGAQTRCFCYVDDMVSGLMAAMDYVGDPDAEPSDPGFTGPVNLGSDWEITIADLARTILRLTGSTSRLVFQPAPVGDPKMRKPDLYRARETLGWNPETSLETGLQRTIRYFQTRR